MKKFSNFWIFIYFFEFIRHLYTEGGGEEMLESLTSLNVVFSICIAYWSVWLRKALGLHPDSQSPHNSNVKIWKVFTHSDSVASLVTCEKLIKCNKLIEMQSVSYYC